MVRELTHFRFLASEPHQWPNRETKLHAQADLAGYEQLRGFAFAENSDHDDCRYDGNQSRDQPAQPWRDAKIEESLHHNLTGKSTGECGVLPGREERHSK